MNDPVVWLRNIETGVVYLIDSHVLDAIICIGGAACIASGLVIWLAIELEQGRKR